ncbi:hypothetical protein ADT71_20885 [Novosphingobium sp. ST904]|nr:hypothetical protein ADT71_20885 [Novosphingobium sp. ST904]
MAVIIASFAASRLTQQACDSPICSISGLRKMGRMWFHPFCAASMMPSRQQWSPARIRPTPRKRGEPSMDSSHVSALQLKHAGIERQIHDELSRPMPDAVMIQALKKRKLKLKEELLRH